MGLLMADDVERWRGGEVERWRGGEVERWRGGEVERWKRGDVAYLERVILCNLSLAGRILRVLRFHAHDLNPKPSMTSYHQRTSKRPPRFLSECLKVGFPAGGTGEWVTNEGSGEAVPPSPGWFILPHSPAVPAHLRRLRRPRFRNSVNDLVCEKGSSKLNPRYSAAKGRDAIAALRRFEAEEPGEQG